jgi:hypothetical protein
MADMCNIERIMWANDFPHSDSTWPRSGEVGARVLETRLVLVLDGRALEFHGVAVGVLDVN